jgi:hypothetical protein
MPLENLYKNEDDSNRRVWIFTAMAVLFFPAFVFVCYVFNVNPVNYGGGSSSTTYVTPAVEVADHLCSDLPKPEKFIFVSKESFPQNGGAIVILRYQSERGFEEIMPPFLIWFDSNRWKADPTANLTFRKSDQTITIGHNDAVSPNYEIYCSAKDEIISFGT